MRPRKVSPTLIRPWPPVMRPPEAGEFIGLSGLTLVDLARRGKIPVVRFGRAIAFLADDLLEYARRNRETPAGWDSPEPEVCPVQAGGRP